MHVLRTTCRACDSSDLEPVLAFGDMPLSDNLLTAKNLAEGDEPLYPLTVVFCRACSLMQILETVSPTIMFDDTYKYYSSNSDSIMQHSKEHAEGLIEKRGLNRESLVVELASNDGYLLRNFRDQGVPVLGIDPAPGPAQTARRAGIPTLPVFFTRELARQLRDEGRQADVIIANNVFAHVPDLHGFTAGMRTLLKDGGVITIESPYVRDLIDNCEFDTIYHEHLNYYSVTALDKLFRSEELYLNDIEYFPGIHGGTIRQWVGKEENVSDRVREYLDEEVRCGLTGFDYYADFGRRARLVKDKLQALLTDLKADGARIAGYGAAAKGSTMVNYTGVGAQYLDYIVDRNVHKQGRYMPGVHLPVLAPERLVEDMPDYVLLLAWNFREEVLLQQEAYRARGGKFIVPIPTPMVI
jgi:SAM-dependent methyltransferase